MMMHGLTNPKFPFISCQTFVFSGKFHDFLSIAEIMPLKAHVLLNGE
jgi:hypothetical protein